MTALGVLPETFRCAPLGCTLTRAACAERRLRATRGSAEDRRMGGGAISAAACARCEVGAAHVRGETPMTWPDGAPIEIRALVLAIAAPIAKPVETPLARRTAAPPRRAARRVAVPETPTPRPRPEENEMGINNARRMISHDGETLCIGDWARRLGISGTGISARISRGWTEGEAVSTPRGEVPSRLAAAPRPSGPRRSGTPGDRPASARAVMSDHQEPEQGAERGPSMRAVALHYAARGWFVFPLRPRQKTPLTEHGCLDATRERERITAWWQRWPTANVGIATGVNSGLLVVDIDGEEGELALAELVAQHGPLPLVPEVRTGRGRHLYFAFDERVRNSAKRIPKIDTRSTGGYVVAPPSVHPDGSRYEWASGREPRAQVEPAPEWLLERFIAQKPSPAQRAPGTAVHSPPALRGDPSENRYRAWVLNAVEAESRELAREPSGGRNNAVNRSAYKLGGYVATGLVTEGEIERALVDASTANGLVGENGIEDVRGVIRRGLEAGRRSPREIPRLEDRPDSRIAHPAPPGRNARRQGADLQDPGGGDVPPPSDDDFRGPGGPSDEDLPVIFDTFDEDEMARLADEYLAPDPELFQRGGLLVQVLHDTSPSAGIVRSHAQPRIAMIAEAWLRAITTRRIRWMKRIATKDGFEEIRIKPPRHAVSAVATRQHWRHIRKLEGVTVTPIFTHDGSVLTAPGYDPKTGVVLAPHETFPVIPSQPSRQDVDDAIETLRYVVSDFPFESAAHEATFFAAVLTPLSRFAFRGPAPLFLIDANTPGTGKGLLAKIIGLISIGTAPTLIVQSRDEGEERKRITTVAMDGDQVVCVDNIEGRWGSPAMCVALTTDEWSDRVLGGSSTYKGPLLTTWLATANNVQLTTDMVRRVAHLRLLTNQERPEERTAFQIPELEAYVRAHRPKLVAAALTILRGWHVAGRPKAVLPSWGSYEGWSAVVRQAVVWAGLKDPGETRASLRDATDTGTDQLLELIEGLVSVYSGTRMTAGDILTKAKGEGAHHLKDALETWSNGRALSSKTVGRVLLRYRGRIANGRRIQGMKTARQWVWWVETSDGKEVVSSLSFD